jgi:dTDP-L-rhamnose 4-epimerase
MYRIVDYSHANCVGTAVLLEALARRPVRQLVVASSMSVYGEGLYRDADGTPVESAARSVSQLKQRDWAVRNGRGETLRPVATPETKKITAPSVYALTKHFQERLCLTTAPAYGIRTVALRFFNIFGTRQALSNPYTGVMAIFASRLLNRKPPLVNEDGQQLRDFVHVKDVAAACAIALEYTGAESAVFNIGSGQPISILQLARELGRAMQLEEIEPIITERYRLGDIRNCFADLDLARTELKFKPVITLREALPEFVSWLDGQSATDLVPTALRELEERGLTV